MFERSIWQSSSLAINSCYLVLYLRPGSPVERKNAAFLRRRRFFRPNLDRISNGYLCHITVGSVFYWLMAEVDRGGSSGRFVDKHPFRSGQGYLADEIPRPARSLYRLPCVDTVKF